MRIGIMLRSLDEKGGIGVYSRYVTEELLRIDPRNEYVLFYRSASNLGRFSHRDNVTERVVKAPNKALWDQVAIPFACRQEELDMVFHPKFTVPLLAPCKAVMVLHGADWFIPDQAQYYSRLNVIYSRLMLPLYCRKATALISVSKLTTDNFYNVLQLPPGKIQTVYFGPGKHFKRIEDREVLERIKKRYNLPDQFILTLSGYDRGPRKNIGGVLKAYELYHGKTSHKLVIGGKHCSKFRTDFGIPDDGYGEDILFTDWIEQEDLPAIYSLADLYLYPSNLEAFPIPLTEAMACGTPIITSDINGLKEIAGDSALLTDPKRPEKIAEAMYQVLSDSGLRNRLTTKGLARSRDFSWDKCAKETLRILESSAPQ